MSWIVTAYGVRRVGDVKPCYWWGESIAPTAWLGWSFSREGATQFASKDEADRVAVEEVIRLSSVAHARVRDVRVEQV